MRTGFAGNRNEGNQKARAVTVQSPNCFLYVKESDQEENRKQQKPKPLYRTAAIPHAPGRSELHLVNGSAVPIIIGSVSLPDFLTLKDSSVELLDFVFKREPPFFVSG